MSVFDQVSLAPSDQIFGLVHEYTQDKRSNKMSFVVGYYRSEEDETTFISAVREAERRVVEKLGGKEYLPIEGDRECLEKLGELIFGELWGRKQGHFAAAQTIGGTNALRLMGDFWRKEVGDKAWVSDPTWANHAGIFKRAGLEVGTYPYYDFQTRSLAYETLMQGFEKLPSHSLVVLHASCHNPTGMDLTLNQWKELSSLFLRKKLFPFFDMAYQGFGEGLNEDAAGVRCFAENGHEMAVAYSCAKNFSLYGERVGALFILSCDEKNIENVRSQLRFFIRGNYSNPPRHGAAIVKEVLSASDLKEKWQTQLSEMQDRIGRIRIAFSEALSQKNPNRDWSFIKKGKGLFCYSGLSQNAVEKLKTEYGLYMSKDGRINLSAIRLPILNYLVDSITSCI